MCLFSPPFQPTNIKAPFIEQFTDDWSERWTPSEATKKTPVGTETFSYVGKWAVEEPTSSVIEGDLGLVAKNKAAHHGISAAFHDGIDFKDQPLVVQYEVRYQQGGNCGGGYVKLLEDGFQTSGKDFDDHTPWVIMFGPDLTCPGTKVTWFHNPFMQEMLSITLKLHFIFRHKNPITGEYQEKHLKNPPKPTIEKLTNLYTLIVQYVYNYDVSSRQTLILYCIISPGNNTFEVLFNGVSERSGSLLEEFDPAVNPPKEIDDPKDSKPSDWVDQKNIADPKASKVT